MGENWNHAGPNGAAIRPPAASPFRLGAWAVYPALNRVALGDQWVQVEPRVMHVLVCLASRPGAVFSRETLLELVWADVVVCEEALTRTISELRRIFQDDPRESRYIETIRKGGYRLIAPVSPLPEPSAAKADPLGAALETVQAARLPTAAAVMPTPATAAPVARAARHRRVALVAALMVLAAVAVAVVVQRVGSRAAPRAVTLEGVPLTTYAGSERYPALSPDGTRVAFAWDGGQAGRLSLYIKQPYTESPLQITDSAGSDAFPTWSPDGSTIAFSRRHSREEYEICTVPAIGGVTRRLLALEEEPCGLDWSPDGAWIAFGWAQHPGRAKGIALLSLETLETHAITHPPARYGGDALPAFSPDGQSLVFRRVDAAMMDCLCIVATRGGEPRRLGLSQGAISGVDWTPEGTHLIFAASSGGNSGLVRLALGDQSLTRLVTKGEQALRPSVSPTGDRLVYEEVSYRADVYRIDLHATGSGLSPQPWIASTRADAGACFSPDGTMVAFVSNRSGTREIWVCDADGSHPRQLTHVGGQWVTPPCWSPDGRWLAFSVDVGGCFMVHVTDAEGGPARRIPSQGRHQIASLWSADGQWIFYDAEREDGWDIQQVHPDGSSPAVAVPDGRLAMAQSHDGRGIYHRTTLDGGVWYTTLGSDTRALLVDAQTTEGWSEIAPGTTGAYFTRPNGWGSMLGYCDYATGRVDSLLQLPLYSGGNLTLSPDEGVLLYDSIGQVERDLMLVEGFR